MASTQAILSRDRIGPGTAALVVVLCMMWGLNQVAIKFTNGGFHPVMQAELRSLLGTGLVVAYCFIRRIHLFDRDGTLGAGLLAGLLFGLEFLLIFVGLDYTSASRGALFIYSMPFWVALGAHFMIPGERLTLMRTAGLIAAFAGMVLAFSDDITVSDAGSVLGDFFCLLAGFFWGATIIVIKMSKLRFVSSEKVLVYQLAVSALMFALCLPFVGPLLRDVTALSVGALAFQIVVIVTVTYVAWFWLVRTYPAALLSSFTFLTPIFGVLFGALVLGEPISAKLGLALALVCVGIVIVNRPAAPPVQSTG